MAKCYNNSKRRHGASNPTPTTHKIPKEIPRTLDGLNAIDNLQIVKGTGTATNKK